MLTIYTLYQVHKGYTTDGSFIDYEVTGLNAANGGAPTSGLVWFPNGTSILYGAPGSNAIYPVQIVDANGNMINISYRNNQGPQIETITDTLGRTIQFYYDSGNLLTAITVPGLADSQGGSTPRQAIRLHYRNHTLDAPNNYGFSGLAPFVQNSTVPVIDAVFYPGTSTGYWFGDSDSYSSYGMLNKVIEQRGMSFTDPGLTIQGTINPGSMSRQRVFNYPMVSSGLTDVPKYTTMTDTWAAMYVNPAVTQYLIFEYASPRRVEITRPDMTKLVQLAHNNPGQYNDGQVYQDEFYNAQGTRLTQTFVNWEQGDYQSPRPSRMELTNERLQKMGREYSYGSRFNQVTEVREYDYGYVYGGTNTLLRKTVNYYPNDPNYTNQGSYWRHIFNLVSATELYAGDGMTRLARTEYYYDEFKGAGANGLQACPNIVYAGHDLASDPYVPGAYNPVTEYRGNVTTIKRFADPIGLNPATAEVETRRYDVAGNLVKTNSSCCEQTTITLNESTQYTWPTSVTRGSVSNASHQNTTGATYDFNTGLVKTSTDANGRISQILYETANLRPTWEYAPTGAYNYYIYDDAGLIVYDLTYEVGKSGGDFASRSDKYLDGFGRVHGEVAYGAGYALDIVNTKYDEFGRIMEQTRPYRFGDAQKWYTQEFDPLGRVKKVTIPDTSGIVEYFYNDATYPDAASSSSAPGQTVRLKDQWGRERWGRFDALGRLAEVVEPNPDPVQNPNQTVATGGWLTEYKYNARDELEEAWQWEPGKQWKQLRKFRYDGLGRLTHQKLAERDATLNDSGAAGSTWSDDFSYDPRSRLVLRVDARRVRTNFSYYNPQLGADDPLNRLQSVSYDKSQAIDAANIIDAPSVTYNYMTTNDKERLQNVTLSNGVGNLTFGYDSEGRLNQRTQTFTGISGGYSLVTGYTYDSLSRIWRITYPQQFFGSWANRVVEHTYDIASRLSSLKYDSSTLATITDYNADSQTLGMSVGSLTESYTYDPGTGLLTNQRVKQGATDLLSLDYYYTAGGALSNTGAKTGQLTKLVDNKNPNRNRAFTYDALTRLTAVSGGSNAPTGSPQWRQKYAYDRFGNRSGVAWDTSGGLIIPSNVPLDGLATLAFTDAQGKVLTNRITTSGYAYDSAGNQTSGQAPDGSSQSYKYDAAGRLAEVKITGGAVLATYSYGAGNERLIASENGGAVITYYAWSGGQVIAEYQQSGSALSFQKGYVYMGGRLLLTENTSGDRQYHHANRLGTQLVTNASTGAVISEQIGLPYGTMLPSGSVLYGDGSYQLQNNQTKRRFTSYDRSSATGLDYAVNRTYNSGQGRFTQVDPIGMEAVQLDTPQTLNLYSYCGNDPVNHIDPDGLFFGFLIGVFAAIFGAIGTAIAVVAKVIVQVVLTVVVSVINAIGTLLVNLFDKVPWLKSVLITSFTDDAGGVSWKRLIISSAIAGAGAVASQLQARKGKGKVRLSGTLLTAYNAARDRLLKLLRNPQSDCAKFLKSKGIDPNKVANVWVFGNHRESPQYLVCQCAKAS